MSEYVADALRLAGLGQIVLVLASVAIPRCLDWKGGLAVLPTLLRQMFWTYAIYITGVHLFAGLVSFFGADELVNGSFVSTAVCVLMVVWWGARIVIQFFFFDKTDVPDTAFNKLAELGLVMLFVFLTLVYGWAVMVNLGVDL